MDLRRRRHPDARFVGSPAPSRADHTRSLQTSTEHSRFRSWALLLALAVLPALSCSSSDPPKHTPPLGGAPEDAPAGNIGCTNDSVVDRYSPGMSKAGISNVMRFELVASNPGPPARGNNAFTVKVTALDGSPVRGELTVKLEMPDHGHTAPVTPSVSYDATQGAYTLAPLDLFMVGLWRITLTMRADTAGSIEAGAAGAADATEQTTDSGVFSFCVD